MQTVGIIPSPGIAHQHAKKIIPNVKQLLSKRTKQVNGISKSKSIS